MTAADLAKFQAILLTEQKKLEGEIANLASKKSLAEAADAESHGDREDESAAEVAEFSDSLSLESELTSALKDVMSALKSIEAGTYGKCKYCHQTIDTQRLMARPTSTSCIACKKTLTQEM